MRDKLYLAAIIPAILGFILIAVLAARILNNKPETSLYEIDYQANERRLVGIVQANNYECEDDDSACYLVVDTEGNIINIAYAAANKCDNGASMQGYSIESGQEIEVYGKSHSSDLISTCESAGYYIRKI